MTTQEKLLAEARPIALEAHCRYCPGENNDPRLKCKNDIAFSTEDIVKFALAQLRAAKESGHLRHKRDCASNHPIFVKHEDGYSYNTGKKRPCSCGFAERFGDL